MSEQNIATRLKLFMEREQLTSSQFADTCGVPRPTFSQLLSGRNKKISDAIISLIHASYPDLSIMWLLFGEGDMYVDGKVSDSVNDMDTSVTSNEHFTDDNFDANIFSDADFTPNNSEINNSNTAYISDVNFNKIQSRNSALIKKCAQLEEEINHLTEQLNKARKQVKRVTQITVYFDDSTFEIFTPKN